MEFVVIIQAGNGAVILNLGAVEDRVLREGVYVIVPFVEQVNQREIRTLKYQAEASAASNDLQQLQTVIALNYHVNPNNVYSIYQQLRLDHANRISPTIHKQVKQGVK